MCGNLIIGRIYVYDFAVSEIPMKIFRLFNFSVRILFTVDDSRVLQEDAKILKVIESYCTSARTRHTVNSCKSLSLC